MKKLAFSISGGGMYFGALAQSTLYYIRNVYEQLPDVVAGTSSGSLIGAILAVHGADSLEILDQILKEFHTKEFQKQIWDVKPLTNNGKMTWKAIWRLATMKESYGLQNEKRVLRKYISPEQYYAWKSDPCAMKLYVCAVDIADGSRVLWDLKNDVTGYELFLNKIAASTRIPVFTQPQEVQGRYYVDGGIRDHNPSNLLLEKEEGITDLLTVYSRPENFIVYEPKWRRNGWLSILNRMIQIFSIEVSKSDEQIEEYKAYQLGINLKQFFVPHLLNNYYDSDSKRHENLRRTINNLLESQNLNLK